MTPGLRCIDVTFAGSIILIVAGAILRFATDLHTVGLVLIVVGILGLLLGLWQWALWSRGSRREETEWEARR